MGIILLRTVIVYAIVVFSLRVMGKRQLGELQPSELVVTILVSNLATMSIENTDVPLLGSVLPIFTLVIFEVLVSLLTLKSNALRKFIYGNTRVFIRDGVIDQKEMRTLRWSIDDLMEQLRINSIFDVNDVSFAIVETSGKLSAYLKYSERPATPAVMSLETPENGDSPAYIVISDGTVIEENLLLCGLDRKWLDALMLQNGINSRNIFLMTCNRGRQHKIIMKDEERRKS